MRAIYNGPAGDGSVPFDKQKDLMKATGLRPPAISKHLAYLRRDELLDKGSLTATDTGKVRLADLFPGETFEWVYQGHVGIGWRVFAAHKPAPIYFSVTAVPTVLDDYSRYIIAWKLCSTMRAEDVTDTLDMALTASGCDQAHVHHKPRLLSDNGPSYIAA